MAFHQTWIKDKLAHLISNILLPATHHFTDHTVKIRHPFMRSLNQIIQAGKKLCNNLVGIYSNMTNKCIDNFRNSHENRHRAVNTCKYRQEQPQAKRTTAHLYLNCFNGMTYLPLRCSPIHEHTFQECPLTTSKTSSLNTLSKTEKANLDSDWTLEFSSSPSQKHIHLPLPVCSSVSLTHIFPPTYDISAGKPMFMAVWWVILGWQPL